MMPGLRVTTLAPDGTEAYDLTDKVDGLSWSSVNPGGDERCTFELKRKWFAGAPEIAQMKLVRVTCGLDILGQFRIEENDRAVADSEKIGVTAYGLGNRLKDSDANRLLIVDRDLSQWRGAGLARQIQNLGANLQGSTAEVAADTAGGNPSLTFKITDNWASPYKPLVESWYDAGPGLKVGVVYHNWASSGTALDAAFVLEGDATDTDDGASTIDTFMSDRIAGAALSSPAGYQTLATARRYVFFDLLYGTTPGGTAGATWLLANRNPAVYGTHGLTRRGGSDPGGFWGSDVVTYLLGLASGVTARRIDASSLVVPHLVWRDGVTFEQMIVDTTRFENPGVDWGTWGPDSVLDNSLNGLFDWKAKDPSTQHWFALRSQCDDISLNAEVATLYDQVDVAYQDAAGTTGVETRTATVPALLGSHRKKRLDGGTLTQAGAQQLGDAFLALSAQRPPARGSVALTGRLNHYRRGSLPPVYMRADGSNLRLPDVLPSEDALSLSSAPDRRTTFPVKRVTVDASGDIPKVSVDVDQSLDTLAILQARLQLAAQLAAGRAG
jgi:hypothetical protein